jgi:hypothetical protein
VDPQNMHDMRTPLARAIGLGSAKEGAGPWWAERVSAIALVPLTLWFVASIIAHTGSDYATFIVWLRTPLKACSSKDAPRSAPRTLPQSVRSPRSRPAGQARCDKRVRSEAGSSVATAGVVATLRIAFTG